MQIKRKPGRPPQADRTDISLVALRLFEEHGYENVTMDQVAKEARVGRTTLFRLFPSKADLVWEGLDRVLDPVKTRAAELERDKAPLHTVVDALVLPALGYLDDPELAAIARRRLRLAGASLELLGYPRFAEMQGVLSATLAAGLPAGGTPPTLVADMLVAATFSAVLWWARQDEGAASPREALRAGLRALHDAT